MHTHIYNTLGLCSMSMFGSKESDAVVRQLMKDKNELSKALDEARNTIHHLLNNSKRWARKFSDPRYQVPDKIIKQMEEEHLQVQEKARAELDKLTSRCAILTNRVVELTIEKTQDRFGTAQGNPDVSYELATDHIEATLTEEDHKDTSISLSKAWAAKMKALSKRRK